MDLFHYLRHLLVKVNLERLQQFFFSKLIVLVEFELREFVSKSEFLLLFSQIRGTRIHIEDSHIQGSIGLSEYLFKLRHLLSHIRGADKENKSSLVTFQNFGIELSEVIQLDVGLLCFPLLLQLFF